MCKYTHPLFSLRVLSACTCSSLFCSSSSQIHESRTLLSQQQQLLLPDAKWTQRKPTLFIFTTQKCRQCFCKLGDVKIRNSSSYFHWSLCCSVRKLPTPRSGYQIFIWAGFPFVAFTQYQFWCHIPRNSKALSEHYYYLSLYVYTSILMIWFGCCFKFNAVMSWKIVIKIFISLRSSCSYHNAFQRVHHKNSRQ